VNALTPGEVPKNLRDAAEYDLKQAAAALRMDLTIRWWSDGGGDGTAAWVDMEDTRRLNISLEWAKRAGAKDLMYVVFHEARHCWQNEHKPWLIPREAEKDADTFAAQETGIVPENASLYWER
jgi:hypothetical protein